MFMHKLLRKKIPDMWFGPHLWQIAFIFVYVCCCLVVFIHICHLCISLKHAAKSKCYLQTILLLALGRRRRRRIESEKAKHESPVASYEFESTSYETKNTSCKIKRTSWEIKKYELGD